MIVWCQPAVNAGNGFQPEVSGKLCFVQRTLQAETLTVPGTGLKGRVRVAKIAESTREPGGNSAGANVCRRHRIPKHL